MSLIADVGKWLDERRITPGPIRMRMAAWTSVYVALSEDRATVHRALSSAITERDKAIHDRESAIAMAKMQSQAAITERAAADEARERSGTLIAAIQCVAPEATSMDALVGVVRDLAATNLRMLKQANEREATIARMRQEATPSDAMRAEVARVKGERDAASEALGEAIAMHRRADVALDKFMSAVGDQTIQIMELRSALREVKPDHPMFGGAIPGATETTKA